MTVTTNETTPAVAPLPTGANADDSRQDTVDAPRTGSRRERMSRPLSKDVLRRVAEENGVCVRPMALRRTDRDTGLTEIVDIPCGARLASKCKPCAERNRKLRQQQIREGWHLTDEPAVTPDRPTEDVTALIATRAHLEFDRAALAYTDMTPDDRAAELAAIDAAITDVEEELSTLPVRGKLTGDRDAKPRKTRSTKRRQDSAALPRLAVDTGRTVGKVYAGRDGKTYQPSTLLTVTLGSYGPVHTGARTRRGSLVACECGTLHGQADPVLGTPIEPDGYDYRQAALDAIFFAATLDRFWQNLRRAAGWAVQYAGAVEMQRRLAPHAHFAVRGTLPRALLRQVADATYHQVWWPSFDQPVYSPTRGPVWDADLACYVDPKTKTPLTTWEQAVAGTLAPDAQPAHVARLGRIDARGINHGTRDAEKSIRYVTKYVTKDLTEHAAAKSDPQKAHFDRLHDALSVLPCSPTCANWLLYGVQPDKAKAGLVPGRCSGKVHQRATLGYTGRRVLISRQWSGKTLADHRADNAAWIRTILSGALADDEQPPDVPGGRYVFELASPNDPDVPPMSHRLIRAIGERMRWRTEIGIAKAALAARPDPSALVLAA